MVGASKSKSGVRPGGGTAGNRCPQNGSTRKRSNSVIDALWTAAVKRGTISYPLIADVRFATNICKPAKMAPISGEIARENDIQMVEFSLVQRGLVYHGEWCGSTRILGNFKVAGDQSRT